MKKIISLCLLLISSTLSFATANNEIPDEFSIRLLHVGYSGSENYYIGTNTQKLGTLVPRSLHLKLNYDLYDANDVKTASAKVKFNREMGLGILEVDDPTGTRLGTIKAKLLGVVFPTYEILGPDNTQLASAVQNFWRTKIHIHDPATGQEMAIMSSNFIRRGVWNFKVTNPSLFKQKNIDSRLFLTALAVEHEKLSEWRTRLMYRRYDNTGNASMMALAKKISKRTPLLEIEALDKLEKPSSESLEAEIIRLDEEFNAQYPTTTGTLNNEERAEAFIAYCINQASSPHLTLERRKAIETVFNMRMNNL